MRPGIVPRRHLVLAPLPPCPARSPESMHDCTKLCRFAHSDLSQQECLENAEATLKAATALIPGGWRNIRAVHLKSAESLALPVMQVRIQ